MKELTYAYLVSILHYDPSSGVWVWRKSQGMQTAGKLAGYLDNGYRTIRIRSCNYRSARLAFLYMTRRWPEYYVDHIDGDPSNDRWNNLRAATPAQNIMNTKLARDNRSGYKGVSWSPRHNKWRVRIRQVYVGWFSDIEEAHAAYVVAAEKHFGEFARVC